KEGGYGERKSYGEKKSYGDKKPYEKREGGYGERKSYGEKKSYGDKKEGGYGERKSYGDKKPYEKREGGYGERKSYGEKKSYGDKKEGGYGERKTYGEKKSYGDKNPYEKREGGYGERKSYGDKKEGGYGERKTYGEKKSYGDKKPYEKREGGYGERKSYGEKKSYGDKKEGSYGERKSYGEKKSYNDDSTGFVKKEKIFEDDFAPTKKTFAERKSETDKRKAGRLETRKSAIEKRVKGEDEEWETFENTSASDFVEKKTRKRSIRKKADAQPTGTVRLNRFISNTGLCSRREADDLITAGVIKINGKIVSELGTKVMPGDVVHYGDQLLRSERKAYILLNKPKDFITTTDDEEGRRTVLDLVDGAVEERLYPVGRLDRNTTGLLLLTNDGEIAERLMHPRYGIRKIYQVSLDRPLHKDDFEKIANGVELEDGPIKPDEISYVGDGDDRREVGVIIHSGRNRIVRRIFESMGYEVERLDRVSYAGLTKKDLPRGRWRHLTTYEVNMLKMLLGKEKKEK
ncbi:MAG: pseudouridine synthase, partial [Bacteroidia bacterium]